MSKRSSRRKRKQQQKRQAAHLTGPVLTKQGRQAFKQGNYHEAIAAWEQARRKGNTPPKLLEAMAEAYFRRAVSSPAPNLADLKQAVHLKPADACYRYHLALAHHRLGQLDQAEPIYRQLLAKSPPFERAASPLAQLLIEQKKSIIKDPVWNHLGQEAKTQLAAAEAIIKRQAASTLRHLADNPLEPEWRGLIAMALDDRTTARQSFQAILESSEPDPALPRGVALYYLGVLAAEANQTKQAMEHWRAAQSNGLDTPHLRQNLSAMIYRQVLAEQQAGRPARALELFEQIDGSRMANTPLTDLYRQLNFEQGYAASQRGNWAEALRHWEAAENAGDDSRKLLLNLALAYQHLERHYEAAESWRTLLRRRPRKASHPEALSDEQVARIWQNVAENYNKTGDYEEAIKTYKNAVKWAPDNVELRLKLVEALQSEGRWQAAENELYRILDKKPDHVPALTVLANMYADDFFPDRARSLWLRILELEPQNPIARQQLAHLYEKQGQFAAQWGQLNRALQIYKEGLDHVPDSQRLHVMIGGTYAELGDFDQAREYSERALAINPNDLQTLYTIFLVWLEYESEPGLKQVLDRIKAITTPIPSSFFFDLIDRSFEAEQDDQAKALLEYVETRYSDDEKVLVGVATHYANIDQQSHAISILRRVLKNDPVHAEANLRLGSIYYEIGQTRLARRHWKQAEQQARKENDQILLYQLKMDKDFWMYGKSPPQNPIEVLRQLPPELKRQMLDQLPPEAADILNMDPDILELMMGFDYLDDFEDDEDDYYYV